MKKEYLKLYIGSTVRIFFGEHSWSGRKYGDYILHGFDSEQGVNLMPVENTFPMWYTWNDETFKLLLRPMSTITKKETSNSRCNIVLSSFGITCSPKTFDYLLSEHFDLFNLIEEGLALDKTKL